MQLVRFADQITYTEVSSLDYAGSDLALNINHQNAVTVVDTVAESASSVFANSAPATNKLRSLTCRILAVNRV